jgi:hypothetical protein
MNGMPPGYPPPGPQYGAGFYPQVRSRLQCQAYVRARFEAGQPVVQMLAEMAASGVSRPDADGLVAEVIGVMRRRALAIIAVGCIAVLVGLAVTVITMQAAKEAAEGSGSGMYVVWWGPVVFGAIGALYGLRAYLKIPSPHR